MARFAALAVFDVTRRETFTALENKWLSDVQEYASSPDVIKLILGNKTDVGARCTWSIKPCN